MASPSNAIPPQPHRRHRSIAGPIVLITIGVLLLLANIGVLTWSRLDFYFERYWPLLIILWGVVKLVEYMAARQRNEPPPGVGAGAVVLIVLLVFFGLGVTGVHRAVGDWHNAFGDWNGNFDNAYDVGTQETQQPIKSGATVQVAANNGDITISTWDQAQVKVVAHRRVSAESLEDAKTVGDATKTTISADGSGDRVTIDAGNITGTLNIRRYTIISNLEIFLPRNAAVDLNVRRGDIVVHGRSGLVRAATSRGDISLQDVTGNAEVSTRRGDLRADGVTGDVRVDGHMGDVQIANVGGEVRLDGEVTGSIHVAKVAKGVQFTSSRTDLHIAKLDGELSIDGSDLSATQTSGPLTLTTRSKNVRLEDVAGDLRVTTTNGSVNIVANKLPLGNMEINDHRGEVQISVPGRANFYLQATTTHGEIASEFGGLNTVNQSRISTASGNIGSGGPRVQIVTDGGDIQIHKTS